VAFLFAWATHWSRGAESKSAVLSRITLVVGVFVIAATLAYAYVRRQWLQFLRQQMLAEVTDFVYKAQGLDAVTAAAMTLIQEVELVSRGYRLWVTQRPSCFKILILSQKHSSTSDYPPRGSKPNQKMSSPAENSASSDVGITTTIQPGLHRVEAPR
jgi:hypothetical protein